MKLSTFIKSSLISIHLVKIFHFFLYVFTWNRQSNTQKFKLRRSFIRVVNFWWKSALNVFLFPSDIYLLKSKSREINLRTKRETSVVYSVCQISKMELFAETLNGFQQLTIVFIAKTNLYRWVFRTQSNI